MKTIFLIVTTSFLLTFQMTVFAKALTTNNDINYSIGNGSLNINNNSGNNIAISKIEFDDNVDITSVWGPLGNNASISKTQKDDSTYHFTVAESNPISIPASAQASLGYAPGSHLGPFEIQMPPTNVSIVADGKVYQLQKNDVCQGAACNDPTPGKRIMGYYSDWDQYAIHYFPQDIPIDKANTINYSFINYDKAGNVILYDAWADQKQLPAIADLRQRYPYLNASLSFGGWTLSANFSDMVNDPQALDNFVKQAVAAMEEVNFNGIDIDWEYPVFGAFDKTTGHMIPGKREDAANYAKLLTKLRSALDAAGKKRNTQYYLSIAAPAGVDKILAIQQADPTAWKKITAAIDYLDIMTYDFHGAWDQYADFQSAMQIDLSKDPYIADPMVKHYNVRDALMAYGMAGVPASKVVIGLPAYGRMMNVQQSGGDLMGLYQTSTGVTPEGEYDWADPAHPITGMFDYKCIADNSACHFSPGINLLDGLVKIDVTNPNAQFSHTPWGFIPGKNQFITYDNVDSVRYKAEWAMQHKFAGVMFWEFSGDLPGNNPQSLINSVYKVFTQSH